MSFWTRERVIGVIVGVITVIITLILIALFDREASSKVPFDCFDATERERVREITLLAMDKGLEQAVTHLYSVWQKDPDSDQPKRAQVGVANALNAHNRARRFALAWSPPVCPPQPKEN
jgi:hypothetical protein